MISFVYFDLGGVMIDDLSAGGKWQSLTDEIGVPANKRELFKTIWTSYEAELCTTRDVETMIPIIEKEVGATFPAGYTFMSAFVERFHINERIWPIVRDLQTKTKIGLLTNVYPKMLDEIIRKGILPDVSWNQVIDSSVVLARKPDTKIFQAAQDSADIPGENILFIDNKQENVDAGKAFGWQTFYYDSSDHEQSTKALAEFLDQQQFSR